MSSLLYRDRLCETSGKCEGRLYVMKSATAKKTAKNLWRLKAFPKTAFKNPANRIGALFIVHCSFGL